MRVNRPFRPGARGRDDLELFFGEMDVDRLGALAAPVGFGFESNLGAFIQSRQTRLFERGDMNENVLAPIIGRNESKAARMVEEFDRASLAHQGISLSPFILGTASAMRMGG